MKKKHGVTGLVFGISDLVASYNFQRLLRVITWESIGKSLFGDTYSSVSFRKKLNFFSFMPKCFAVIIRSYLVTKNHGVTGLLFKLQVFKQEEICKNAISGP